MAKFGKRPFILIISACLLVLLIIGLSILLIKSYLRTAQFPEEAQTTSEKYSIIEAKFNAYTNAEFEELPDLTIAQNSIDSSKCYQWNYAFKSTYTDEESLAKTISIDRYDENSHSQIPKELMLKELTKGLTNTGYQFDLKFTGYFEVDTEKCNKEYRSISLAMSTTDRYFDDYKKIQVPSDRRCRAFTYVTLLKADKNYAITTIIQYSYEYSPKVIIDNNDPLIHNQSTQLIEHRLIEVKDYEGRFGKCG
jgi:hypothetical protein